MTKELDALDPVPETVTLSSGTVLVIEDLKARQFFKLLRILTRGALPNLQDSNLFKFDGDIEPSAWAGKFLSLMLLSVPEAEDETIEFIVSMVKPWGIIERRGGTKLNKADTERNTELWTKVLYELDNPDLDDLVTIIEAVVRREAEDIQALGKRLAAMFRLAEKTGMLKQKSSPPQSSPESTFSEDSPASSTFSSPIADGPRSSVEMPHSNGSDRLMPQPGSLATTSSISGSSG